ncbi:Transcription factor, MADS-box [Corchorus olitorius]|uniref:Transcription factor, MADS-box n=1 Tax=Corchorus olitorius TaxID=93759 RepID=A0A1R3H3T5_9ROSI|nr:Transcription factor, MADS-box [Corchorus olitorius]
MGRGGKLRLKLVENEKTRAAIYNMRLAGLKKKAKELTILCNLRLCMVILGPKLKNKPIKVCIWPEDHDQVKSMVLDCKKSTFEKKIFTINDYMNLRRKKVENEIAHVRRANFKVKFPTWDDRFDNLSPKQRMLLRSKLDSKIEAAKIKLMAMKGIQDPDHDHLPAPYTGDLISAAFPPKNLCDNYLESHFPLKKTLNPFDHPQNSLDYGLFMGQHSGNYVESHHLPIKSLTPFDRHIPTLSQKNLDYGLTTGQHSGNQIQSHDRNQFDHFQSFPQKNCGLFMEPPPIVSTLSQGDYNLLNLSLNLNANKNRLNPIGHHKQLSMSMMNNVLDFNFQPGASSSINQNPMTMLSMMNDHLDFNFQQSGLASSSRNIPNTLSFSPLRSPFSSHHDHHKIQAAHHDSMPTMQDNVMFKQPKPYDAWFHPPSMQPDHQASNFDLQQFLRNSKSDSRFRSEFLEFYH